MGAIVRALLLLAVVGVVVVTAVPLRGFESRMEEVLRRLANAEDRKYFESLLGGSANITVKGNVTVNPHKPICRDLVIPSGVPCEEFEVLTEDGFELSLIHLPPLVPGSPVVYLQHGLLSAASVWVDQVRMSGNSLGYDLRAAGYDVWAGNSRGNWYSLGNTKYTVKDKALWEAVDWQYMAQYDLPAFINFILKTTGKSSLSYIGHSQGTTQAFAAFSEGYGNLCSQVNVFIALAPVARALNVQSASLKSLAAQNVDSLVGLFGWASWPPLDMDALTVLEKINVTCDSPDRTLCENILYDIGGATQSWVNQTQMEEDMGFDPAGTSMQNLKHWLQSMRFDGFRKFDYGLGNLAKYGTWTVPKYDLSKVCTPMAIFSGGLDELAAPVDVAWTISQLPADKVKYQKVLPAYQHNDFVWSVNAHTDFIPYVMEQLAAYAQH
jgi:lysosomal acid lipase/cholesteryl ester hydrolase